MPDEPGVKLQIQHYPCDGCGKEVTDFSDDGEVKRAAFAITHPTKPSIRFCLECIYQAAIILKTTVRRGYL